MIKMTNEKNNKEINSEDIKFCRLKEEVLNGLTFDCEEDDKNDFLFNDSINHMEAKISIVYLFKYKKEVIGYIALSNDSIKINNKDKKKMKIRYAQYPAIKIGRLGVTKDYQRKGIGTMIIDWAIWVGIKIGHDLRIRYLSVDSVPESKTFYEKNGFKLLVKKENTLKCPECGFKLEEKENDNTLHMYLDLIDKNHP
jgi:GNAT superfamily N-acetyltransferase